MTDLPIPTNSVTFLITDIQGSTKLWEQYPEAMKTALARHDTILRDVIEAHNGDVFKTVGDAFYAAFANPTDALTAALTAQRALYAEAWGEAVIKVRMGLHTGAVEARDHDYFGPPLNRVTRLTNAGHGGQVLLSAVTDELVRGQLPLGVELRDMGEWRLRDLSRLEHIYQLVIPGLPADFPPLRALDAFRTNLPAQLTSFVGREKETVEIAQLIAANRLVTLMGPGGTGKTRLSLRVAADLLDTFGNGVWFVELAPLADAGLILQTVMTTLGLREDGSHSLTEILTDYLRAKNALLILDNCEHLVEAAAQLAETLLQACPQLHLLVSSREAFGIPGETPYRVPSLSIPKARGGHTAESILSYESACLFIERARAASPAFVVSDENAPAIAKICARLDGIPLALELAAARVKILRVEQVAERLDDRFRLLTGGSRTALPRQQTLRALIDWSYDLLSEPERTLLTRLSVFAGGWMLEAAEAVCSNQWSVISNQSLPTDHRLLNTDVLDLLSQLVNKSLVVAESDDGPETRYHMLETIRQYGHEKLLESGNDKQVRDRHLDYFVKMAERIEPELTGPEQVAWMDHLQSELDNIHTALEWALNRNVAAGLRLASAMQWFWINYDYLGDGSEQLTHLLSQSAPPAERAKALNAYGLVAVHLGDFQHADAAAKESFTLHESLGNQLGQADSQFITMWVNRQLDINMGPAPFEENVEQYRALGNKEGLSRALWITGVYYNDNKEYFRASALLEESIMLCRNMGDISGASRALNSLGWQSMWRGDLSTARITLEESLEISRPLGKVRVAAMLEGLGELSFRERNYQQAQTRLEESLKVMKESGQILYVRWLTVRLGYVAMRRGNIAQARAILAESQELFQKSGEKIGVVYALEGLASLAIIQGQPEQASRLFAWADATRAALRIPRQPIEQLDVDRDLATIRTQLDKEARAVAQAAGHAMSMDEAVAYALQGA